jgi:pimeloyl-ACP methyl ester carboxylesterase
VLVVAAFAVAVGAAAVASGAPRRSSHACVQAGEVRFRADDGVSLAAHRWGTGTTAIVLGHGSGSDLCEWVLYARRLAAAGYFVLAIDFRAHGASDRPRTVRASQRLAGDLAAAVKVVRRLGKTQVFLVGSSMGGIASLVAGANVRPPVDGVVSLSAPAAFLGMNAVKTAPRLTVPVLYVAATTDSGGRFARDARTMFGATASADRRLEIFPGHLHGSSLLEANADVQKLVEDFIAAH